MQTLSNIFGWKARDTGGAIFPLVRNMSHQLNSYKNALIIAEGPCCTIKPAIQNTC